MVSVYYVDFLCENIGATYQQSLPNQEFTKSITLFYAVYFSLDLMKNRLNYIFSKFSIFSNKRQVWCG